MENLPPPQEKELPAPHKKLLRSPTFWEKQGKIAKWLAIGSIIVFILLSASALLLKSQKPITAPAINAIEISADQKSILNAQTKEVIFTIENAKNYLKNSGYEYNPDTFQTTNAKYAGDCFIDAALSNNKDRIIFSTGCLPGDLPQAWIGVYTQCPRNAECITASTIMFLASGSGRNFTWSPDDTTITYEADLGLSGLTETRTIDSNTGEILEKKNSPITSNPETANWKTYRNEKYSFEFKYPADFNLDEPAISESGLEYPDHRFYYALDLRSFITENNGRDWNSVFILITVHDKMFELVPLGTDLTNAKEGAGIEEALQKAYAGKTGIVTHIKNNNREESGRVAIGSLFYYVILSSKKSVYYNYSIGIHIPYSVRKDSNDEEIRKFINNYNQILSTFKFLDQKPK